MRGIKFYKKKKYQNPFFRSRKKWLGTINFSWKFKLIVAAIFVLAVFFAWLLCFSSIFEIKNIEIEGLSRISKNEIISLVWRQSEKRRWLVFPQKQLLTFSGRDLVKSLKEKYYFQSLSWKKKLPGTLKIIIKEKPYSFIWNEGGNYYYADEAGYLISETSPLEIKGKKYPLILNEGGEKIYNNRIALEEGKIEYVLGLFNKLSRDAPNLKIEKFIIGKELNTIKVSLNPGPLLYFNISESREKQIEKLLTLKNEKLKNDFIKKTYIDLRYGDRVYYR